MLKKQGLAFPPSLSSEYINVPVGEGVRRLGSTGLTEQFLDIPAESFAERKSPLEQDEKKSKVRLFSDFII